LIKTGDLALALPGFDHEDFSGLGDARARILHVERQCGIR
jgi:hypothetical protein